MNKIARFFKDESGATAIEYGLLAALIGVALIAVINAVGSSLFGVFDKVQTNLDAVNVGPRQPS